MGGGLFGPPVPYPPITSWALFYSHEIYFYTLLPNFFCTMFRKLLTHTKDHLFEFCWNIATYLTLIIFASYQTYLWDLWWRFMTPLLTSWCVYDVIQSASSIYLIITCFLEKIFAFELSAMQCLLFKQSSNSFQM